MTYTGVVTMLPVMTRHTPPIKSTALSLRIVELLQERDGATLDEVAEAFDRPKSTVHDHLRTLQLYDYILQTDGTYRIGTRFLQLGGYARSRSTLFQVAESEIQRLASDTGEHANLLIEENGMGVFLFKVRGREAVRLDTYEGMRVHLHTTALGKAVLAHLPSERVEAILDERGLPAPTPNTISDREELLSELDVVRERGYAIDDEERLEGIRCVAAPIVTDGDHVLGAVSISGPRNRLRGERFREEIPSQVLRTSNIISVNVRHA